MREQRLPVTIDGYVPGQLQQRWCKECGTPDGWYLPFTKAAANPDPEGLPAFAALGCYGCNARSAARAEARAGAAWNASAENRS